MQIRRKLNLLVVMTIAAAISACLLSACSRNEGFSWNWGIFSDSGASLTEEERRMESVICEAEDQIMTGNLTVKTSRQGFSGTGYVDGFKEDSDELVFIAEVKESRFYDLEFTAASDGNKINFVLVDGVNAGEISTDSKNFEVSLVRRVWLSEGIHEISVKKSWGWIDLDKLTILPSEKLDMTIYDAEVKLSNPNATEPVKRLMSYLLDIYGEKMLTGQNCDTGMIGTECAAIYKETGEYPAVLGLDLMNYSPCNVAHGAKGTATTFASSYAKNGGIVTLCWHWTMPDRYVKGNWFSSFYTDSCKFRLDRALSGEDPEGYQALIEGIDAIAEQLLILQDNGVPVLWRPLHEASGGWFWWGACGPNAYKELYRLMYDRLTYDHGCNNLIWVWNGQDRDWYPGDEYVDIIGIDIYPGNHVYTSQIDKFLECCEIPGERKMVVLSENGCLFDPDIAVRDGAMWGFQCTWGGEFVLKNSKFAYYSEAYTEIAMLKKVYESEYMITRSELPDLGTYPIRPELMDD